MKRAHRGPDEANATADLAREEKRLRGIFRRLLAASLVIVPPACAKTAGNPEHVDGYPDDASTSAPDATVVEAASDSPTSDAPADTTSDTRDAGLDADADDGACDPVLVPDATDDSGCAYFLTLPCGLPPQPIESCSPKIAICSNYCAHNLARCLVVNCVSDDAGDSSITPGTATIECSHTGPACGGSVGRRPEGLVHAESDAPDAVGAWLADVARLEAASVPAFRRLARELAAMGAPRALVRTAEDAARDEVRHARVMTKLARRRGAKPGRVVVRRGVQARTAQVFAVENAVEGCIRECFGALVALRMAKTSPQPDVARAMERIAADETRHAAIAWVTLRWIFPRLDESSRARVRRAMMDAVACLRCEVAGTDATLARALGLPAAADGAALVDAFGAEVLAA